MTVKINAILVIAATIAAVGSVSAATTINPRYANMAALTLRQEATRLSAENEALKAGGGGAGPALPPEIRDLVQCVNTNTCDPYIAIAKDKIKAELAKDTVIPASAGKGALLDQLNGFIDGLNNGNLGVANPGAGAVAAGGNPAANEVKTLNALKCAIDVAMVQKVNEEMDRLATTGMAIANKEAIQTALMAVFAGR
ncbi:MAG: hypothetical protein NTW22_05695 [Proteobacteria bacterium]|nr:hypothetical protein [Pseudomonadota bacterium]